MSDPAEPPPSSSSASILEKHQQQHLITTTTTTSSSSPTPPINITASDHHHHHRHSQLTILQQQQQNSPLVVVPPPFDYHPDFTSSVKRPRYVGSNQWKQLPPSVPSPISAPPPPPKPQQQPVLATTTTEGSSPSSSTNPPPLLPLLLTQHPSVGASSSDTAASSPTQQHQALHQQQQQSSQSHGQMRKGKHVSPVWKPYEMLMLAKGWHLLYKTASSSSRSVNSEHSGRGGSTAINKSRAEKDREVAEYLNRHGVERDAKAAGTKWDNMLGDFRKVYQWERGGGRIEAGVAKSYFRLSPYERKNQHGLPTSFDEEVFEEMVQFMGSRIKSNSTSTSLLQHIDDDEGGRVRLTFKEADQRTTATGNLIRCNENVLVPKTAPLRRIGKVKMVWEEWVSLWGEEGSSEISSSTSTTGRMKIGVLPSLFSSFLNADELMLFDDSMVASPLEAYENGPLRGFSVDVFSPGQQVKVFGRRKAASTSPSAAYCHACRSHLPATQLFPRSYNSLMECQDPSEYYLARLKLIAPATLPALSELSMYLQQPPSEELKFPLRPDVYRDLPQGNDLFFTTLSEPLDCRMITYNLLGPILRSYSTPSSSRDSYIALWDDCINSVVSKFCSLEIAFVRKPVATTVLEVNQILWPNVTGFIKGLCLWRGEETDQVMEGDRDYVTNPSKSLVQKTLWTYADLPYIFGYYAVGHIVTLCALTCPRSGSPSEGNHVLRTDLVSIDLSSQVDRLKALIPCWRIATLLPLLVEKCSTIMETTGHLLFSDFERIALGNNGGSSSSDVVIERGPASEMRYFSNKRKWASVKEIYDFLGRRIPHSEYIAGSCEAQLCITLKPRGCKVKPRSVDQLIEALKCVSKCLVALHDLSFMHRDINWETVMRRVVATEAGEVIHDGEAEWFLSGFERAAGAPQMSAYGGGSASHAPEMRRGLHGVKVDVWGIGWLIKTCGLVMLPMQLRDLQSKCLEHNQEMRPTAADCYHHLLQLSAAAAGGY